MSPRGPLVMLVVASVLAGCSVGQSAHRSLPPCEPPGSTGTTGSDLPEAASAYGDGVGRESGERGSRIVYDPPPRIVSVAALANAIDRRYPRRLREAGIGGVVQVRVLVSADGRVEDAKVWQSSSRIDLDRAALEAVRTIRFHPAVAGGCRAATWIQLPIRFSVEEPD